MVQIVENWSDLEGELKSISFESPLNNFLLFNISVKEVHSVEGYRNLLSDAVGRDLEIFVPRQILEISDPKPGSRITCRVRMATLNRIFAHPDRAVVITSPD